MRTRKQTNITKAVVLYSEAVPIRALTLVLAFAALVAPLSAQSRIQTFTAPSAGEAIATISAGCARCDWGASGREAAALRLSLDGAYSQHVLLTRGETPAEYRVMLGPVASGAHELRLERDSTRSAAGVGEVTVASIDVRVVPPGAPDFDWLSKAPFLYARPGTVERFSDVPLTMYVEPPPNESNGWRYTVIFTNEDGGTPTDRLMATWGRTTDIEYVYGIGRDAPYKEEYQGKDHELMAFKGRRLGAHPLLWVSTENNMVSDTGPVDFVRFAPAPELVTLTNVSREEVMDKNPWMYGVMAAEMRREGRIDPAAEAGSGEIPDPRRFAYLEGCGEVKDATLAFDIGVRGAGGAMAWYPTDRGDARFRIARGGCFRGAVPLPPGATPDRIAGVRARAYTRPPRKGEPALPAGTGRATLERINVVFMLTPAYVPSPSAVHWTGTLELKGESAAVDVPLAGR